METPAQPATPVDYISMTQAAKLAPGRPSATTVWRWAMRGVKLRSGDRLHMQSVRFGGKVFTTVAWLTEFGAACSIGHQPTPVPMPVARKLGAKAAERRHAEAMYRLSLA
jgi:hypothetical protein